MKAHFIFASLWLGTTLSQAAILANYNFSAGTVSGGAVSNPLVTTNAVTTTTGYTTTALTLGAGLVGGTPAATPAVIVGLSTTTGSGTPPNTQHAVVRVSGTSSTDENDKVTPVAQDDYFSFTVTPNAGVSLNLTTLSLDLTRSGSTFTGTVFIRSSSDGFTTDLFSNTGSENSSNLVAHTDQSRHDDHRSDNLPDLFRR